MDIINHVLDCFYEMGADEDQLVEEFTKMANDKKYCNEWCEFLIN